MVGRYSASTLDHHMYKPIINHGLSLPLLLLYLIKQTRAIMISMFDPIKGRPHVTDSPPPPPSPPLPPPLSLPPSLSLSLSPPAETNLC